MNYGYNKTKKPELTPAEIKERAKEIREELQEVLQWKKEEEAKINDKNSSHQRISAAKRALKKVARRINTVKGQIIYWDLRVKGQSHFLASIEMNEFWAKCNEENAKEQN